MYVEVRYLDLSGTRQPSLEGIRFMPLLRFLNLSRCALMNVSLEDMPLLNILDLSFNQIHDLNAMQLKTLDGLTHLNLSGNHMTPHLDTGFLLFTKRAGLANLKTLTMVNTGIELLASGVFQVMAELTSLDLRENPLQYFYKQAFEGLGELRVLRADDARVCCRIFHHNTEIIECDSPSDELSSCDDLLKSDFFRVILWVFSVLTITGNAGVLIFRLCLEKEGTSLAYRALVVNLSMSDFLMGVYLAIIGSADAQFQGVYVSRETEWRESNTCKAAGFLALVSSEVSAFALCLITLDRFLVIKFPFSSSLRLTKLSAILACGATWAVGMTLGAFPLFQPDWEFYGQNGICLPLPITQRSFKGQDYAFGVFIVLNFVLFLVIGAGQALIFYNIHSSAMATMKGHRKQDTVIARRLFLIVCTDFCCWFPIGLMGLLASSGIPIPGVVNVLAAVFVLPINSAINPFLYTINALLERRANKMEQKRIEKTMTRFHVELRSWPSDKVEELVQFCLRTNLVQRRHMLRELRVSTSVGQNSRRQQAAPTIKDLRQCQTEHLICALLERGQDVTETEVKALEELVVFVNTNRVQKECTLQECTLQECTLQECTLQECTLQEHTPSTSGREDLLRSQTTPVMESVPT
nr:hypothetical protein BaRGS_017098 [Batillaria attramentaria]